MKMRSFLAMLAIALASALSMGAESDDLFESFLHAVVQDDVAQMQTIVKANEREMAVIFFTVLKESAAILRGRGGDQDEVSKVRALLLVNVKIANALSQLHPGDDLIYSQIKGSEALLTSRARQEVTSEESMGKFMESCRTLLLLKGIEASVAADLDSLFQAACETPEKRLIRLLREQQDEIRREAAELRHRQYLAESADRLARLRASGDDKGLLEMLDDEQADSPIMEQVIAALGELKSLKSVGRLSRALTNESLRVAAVTALGRIGGQEAATALAGHVGDPGIYDQVVAALDAAGREHAAKALVLTLSNETASASAASALIRLWGDEAAVRFQGMAVDTSQPKSVRRQAVGAFSRVKATNAVVMLTGWMADPALRAPASEALMASADPDAIPVFIELLDDEDLAPSAMAALSRFGPPAWGALSRRIQKFTPVMGMRRASQVLTDSGYSPKGLRERAFFAFGRDRFLPAVAAGPAGFAVALSALRSQEDGLRRIAIIVLGIDLVVPAMLVVGLILWLRRDWLWPALKARLPAGGCKQFRKAVPRHGQGIVEPGTIRETLWARNRRGLRQRIKVETLVAGESWDTDGGQLRSFVQTTKSTVSADDRDDVLVSVGKSVRPGVYLARGAAGSVRVRVDAAVG